MIVENVCLVNKKLVKSWCRSCLLVVVVVVVLSLPSMHRESKSKRFLLRRASALCYVCSSLSFSSNEHWCSQRRLPSSFATLLLQSLVRWLLPLRSSSTLRRCNRTHHRESQHIEKPIHSASPCNTRLVTMTVSRSKAGLGVPQMVWPLNEETSGDGAGIFSFLLIDGTPFVAFGASIER